MSKDWKKNQQTNEKYAHLKAPYLQPFWKKMQHIRNW